MTGTFFSWSALSHLHVLETLKPELSHKCLSACYHNANNDEKLNVMMISVQLGGSTGSVSDGFLNVRIDGTPLDPFCLQPDAGR